MSRIDIVVPCVDRKQTAAHEGHAAMRDARHALLDGQLALWEELLHTTDPRLCARDRYMGEAWQQALQLEEDASEAQLSPVLWVASAGYGLISVDDPVGSYGATFSPPSPDDVGLDPMGSRAASRRRQWWKALARSRPLDTGRPRRLAEIAHANGGAPVIVVASSSYASAFGQDLSELLSMEAGMLVCAGRDLDGSTEAPAFDTRIETMVTSGSRLSLNQRVASLVVQRLARGMDRAQIAQSLRETTARGVRAETPDRDPASDEVIRRFIRAALEADRSATKSPLLRAFRDAGNACEQKRFGALFDQVKQEREPTIV